MVHQPRTRIVMTPFAVSPRWPMSEEVNMDSVAKEDLTIRYYLLQFLEIVLTKSIQGTSGDDIN